MNTSFILRKKIKLRSAWEVNEKRNEFEIDLIVFPL